MRWSQQIFIEMLWYNSTDADECEESTDVTCNMETQVCVNTPGSYQCLEITHVPVTCPNGFKFDPKVKQCIGKCYAMHYS